MKICKNYFDQEIKEVLHGFLSLLVYYKDELENRIEKLTIKMRKITLEKIDKQNNRDIKTTLPLSFSSTLLSRNSTSEKTKPNQSMLKSSWPD